MSPGNQGVFQLLKEVTSRRILTFYNYRKRRCFSGDLSLFCGLCLWQFCSPLFGFFWLLHSFIKNDANSKSRDFFWREGR